MRYSISKRKIFVLDFKSQNIFTNFKKSLFLYFLVFYLHLYMFEGQFNALSKTVYIVEFGAWKVLTLRFLNEHTLILPEKNLELF